MFSSSTSLVGEPQDYDFTKEENAAKWRGVFVNSLNKVLEQVHPSLEARQDALDFVENLILRMLGMLCGHPPPHTPQDIEERVRRTFPTPIDKWALRDAKEALEKGKKKSVLVLPVEKVHQLLQKEVLQHKIDWQVTLFVVGVLEYISADILKLAGNYVKIIHNVEICYEDIKVAMHADSVLMDMFYQDDFNDGQSEESEEGAIVSQTYEESVRDLIQDERQYLRDLQMIIKVFREEIAKLTQDSAELEMLFSNITDLYELTVNLLGSLEDVMEITEEKQTPTVGSCFEELAEAAEFDAYAKYVQDISSPKCREVLTKILSRPEANAALRAAGHGFKEAVKYYLPKLLMQPVWHCFLYFDYIKVLHKRSRIKEDTETLFQVQSLLNSLQFDLEKMEVGKIKRDSSVRMQSRARRRAALEKTNEMKRTVEGWDQKDIGQCCNEFIREDTLVKVGGKNRRLTDRKAFLFDGLLVLCKPCNSKKIGVGVSAVAVTHHQNDYRLKEKFFIRKIDIIDREDTDELKNAFEIATRDNTNVILVAKSPEDKNSWMADLVMFNTKSMLERTLDSILLDEERKHPLKLPPPSMYRFAEPDSPSNIIVEAREKGGPPFIKAATLVKLVERLTYHIYADPAFVRTFLTTYRNFCSPRELLTLLTERFDIPDPAKVYDVDLNSGKAIPKEDFKRYRKEFCQPVQFRVLNVLRHWVDHHYYDFQKDATLLAELEIFLAMVSDNCKSMKKWVDSVKKIVQRKQKNKSEQENITFSFERSPPPIERHLDNPSNTTTNTPTTANTTSTTSYANQLESAGPLLTCHPIELARQLTLYEFELYRKVKPSELVGSAWTKKDKETTSPNLLKMIKHTTNFTRWLEKNILETENFEERVAIVSRVIEILMVLQELNNFNGVLSICSAIFSAAVFRLNHTLTHLHPRLEKALNDAAELHANHYKNYQEKLRSINPPCVPFFGMYLTLILHMEEGNEDFRDKECTLINFNKRRLVAEIIGEIQQYQNQPYCLSVEPNIRKFIEELQPFDRDMSDSEINDYIYEKSIKIEPRCSKAPIKVPRKWPNVSLKTPGIKARTLSGKLPAPLQAVASSVRLHDPPSTSATTAQEILASSELRESSPQRSSFSMGQSDHSNFIQALLGGTTARSPGSPGVAHSISNLSIGSPGNSPQLGSPGHLSHQHQASIGGSSIDFSFYPHIFGIMSGSTLPSSMSSSPGATHPHPSSPSPHFVPDQISQPPPLPPRRQPRENSLVESPQQTNEKSHESPPAVPPRDHPNSPPPLPPRQSLSSATLPPRLPDTFNPNESVLMARRNSSLGSSSLINPGHTRRYMSINGPSPPIPTPNQSPNGSITPRLPPKPGRSSVTMFNFNSPQGSS
ncbi:protein son of sevenless isoform X2 [Copidosoma floridanum]|uniref:protein son of sevenless isoform X2 n=1 Tax=Copidosoma floridanum TaxID=29053 RepID=UPI0006C9E5AD|nr:protein son of sevenless isoform X2 [Copidosoma floridanum]